MAAQKVVTRTGRVKYLSQVMRDRNKKFNRRGEGIDWADWKPKHRTGIFANVATTPYQHNGVTKQL